MYAHEKSVFLTFSYFIDILLVTFVRLKKIKFLIKNLGKSEQHIDKLSYLCSANEKNGCRDKKID